MKEGQQMTQKLHDSPPPPLSASTGISKRSLGGGSKGSLEGGWGSSGAFRKEMSSACVSIAVNADKGSRYGLGVESTGEVIR